jgi:DNA transformation protein
MKNSYEEPPKRPRELNGFGPRSEEILADVGIHTVDEFMAIDPYDLYALIKPIKGMGLNSIYAIIGARENSSWLDIAKTRKIEILMRLDDFGLAPK